MAKQIVTAVLGALALGACTKSEEVNQRPAQPTRIEAPQPQAAPSAEIDPALRERLARQEAASRMFEKNVLEPPTPKEPRPAPARPAEVKTPESQKPAPSEPKVAATPPPKVATTPPPIAPPPAPAPAPAKASPAPVQSPAKSEPPARTDVAAAKPSAAAAGVAAVRLVSRVDPEFPREAIQSGVERGNVKVKVTLDEAGTVTRVEVIDSNPRRVFDRAVVRALSQWKFNEGAAGRTVETEVDFKR